MSTKTIDTQETSEAEASQPKRKPTTKKAKSGLQRWCDRLWK